MRFRKQRRATVYKKVANCDYIRFTIIGIKCVRLNTLWKQNSSKLLKCLHDCAILIVPNQFNIVTYRMNRFWKWEYYTLLSYLCVEFDKMQIPYPHRYLSAFALRYIGLVWRLSEFAFLCDSFGCRTFYLDGIMYGHYSVLGGIWWSYSTSQWR